MRIRTEQVSAQEEEIVVRYHEMTSGTKRILDYLAGLNRQMDAHRDGKEYFLNPSDIYYFESVDNHTFLYTREETYQSQHTLAAVEELLKDRGYFRCNKSTVVNIHHIDSLKSELGSRINAALDNGEHVIISRRYAKHLRELLRGGNGYGEI